MKIISRKIALVLGLPHYFTGKPCKHGHIAERWTLHRGCMECSRQRPKDPAGRRAYYVANRGKEKQSRQKPERRAQERKYNQVYCKTRKKTDLNFRLRANLRVRLAMAIRNSSKFGSAVRDLGCSIPELKQHIEKKFQEGMSWENWGEWHIDHKRPLAVFDLTDRSQLLEAVHYSNLQPLWRSDNLRKGAK